MPRRSEASLSIASFTPSPRRLEPPAELAEGSVERAIFIATVASVPAEHFAAEDLALLAEYARTAALARRASEAMLAGSPIAGERTSPWLDVHRVTTATMKALSVRLRIGARARSTNTRSAKPSLPPSAYELMRGKSDDPFGP